MELSTDTRDGYAVIALSGRLLTHPEHPCSATRSATW